jgi:hypothetical protein
MPPTERPDSKRKASISQLLRNGGGGRLLNDYGGDLVGFLFLVHEFGGGGNQIVEGQGPELELDAMMAG